MVTSPESSAEAKYRDSLKDRSLEEWLPELLPYIHSGSNVLDIGCGTGEITLGVAEAVNPGEVVGIDPVEGRVAFASEAARESGIENVSFKVGEAHRLDFPDDTFDVVFSNTVFHFFLDPVAALKEAMRVVKPGGWVIAAGVRDWGFSPWYPACPNVELVWDAFLQHYEAVRLRLTSGDEIPRLSGQNVPELEYIDLHAGRKCSEWFTAAGLTDLHMDVKPYKWHHSTVNEQEPSRLDLVPFPGDTSNMWWETLQDMLAAGLLDDATVDRARQETKAWYNNPNRFYYWALLFVAGKV